MNSNDSSLYITRANVYEDLAQSDKALKDYNHAIQLKPAEADTVYSNRARVYNDLGQYQKAIEDTNKLIKSTSSASVSRLQTALDSINLTNRGRALSWFRAIGQGCRRPNQAISLKPNISRPGESFISEQKHMRSKGRSHGSKDREMAGKLGYKSGATFIAPLK